MSKKVLVIDDEESVRKSFSLALEATNYHVLTASSGIEGISKVKEEDIDLVFLDLKMPNMDGTETLKKIREINEEVPVYIVTAFEKEYIEILTEIRDKGFSFELFRKPLGREEIISIVSGVLEGPQEIFD